MTERVVDATAVEQNDRQWFVRVTIRFSEPVTTLAGIQVTEAPVEIAPDSTHSQASSLAHRIRTANDPTAYYRAVVRNLNVAEIERAELEQESRERWERQGNV